MHYEPDSPAGKEYALPARIRPERTAPQSHALRKTAGYSAKASASAVSPPRRRSPVRAHATRRRPGASPTRPWHRGLGRRADLGPAAAVRLGDGDGSGPATGLAIGVAVLLGGLALSLVLRRGRRAATECGRDDVTTGLSQRPPQPDAAAPAIARAPRPSGRAWSRDARHRRLLAGADALTILAASLAFGTTAGSGAWLALFLLLAVTLALIASKLLGRFDRDHRVLWHSTADELPDEPDLGGRRHDHAARPHALRGPSAAVDRIARRHRDRDRRPEPRASGRPPASSGATPHRRSGSRSSVRAR